jgi:hypothetical protein
LTSIPDSFATLVVCRDRDLFTGKALIEEIDPQLVRLPTDEEIGNQLLSSAGETQGGDPITGDDAITM